MVVAGGGANQGKDLTSVEVFSECGLPLPHCTLPPPAICQVQCLHHFELPNIQYSLLPRSHFTLDAVDGLTACGGSKNGNKNRRNCVSLSGGVWRQWHVLRQGLIFI